MPFTFTTEQWLPYPVELVFAFFANPENLPRLMPRWQKTRIEEATFAPPPPRPEGTPRYPSIAAGDGTRLLLSVRLFPLSPLRAPWEALIENFRWNEGFCDVQLRGPFKSWRHCHSVHAAPNPTTNQPGCIVRDHVVYELPVGILSPLADKLAAKNALAYTFRYRHKRTAELLARLTNRTHP
jgi:ligand-binding SRPBCC domain-containing protein